MDKIRLGGRLLVVDWDYFFPDPTMTENPGDTKALLLYDWGHRESKFHIERIWPTRAAGFLRNNLPLPRTLPWEGFWGRFQIRNGAPVYICDSNMYAGEKLPEHAGIDADGWAEVHLYDAHHDCGYRQGMTLLDFHRQGTYSCEDWMLVHAVMGSKLFVWYPQWRATSKGKIFEAEPKPARGCNVTRRIDPGGRVDGEFDAVLICRSGAWVPPWCDDQYDRMVESLGRPAEWIDKHVSRHRDWDISYAEQELLIHKMALKGQYAELAEKLGEGN